MSPDDQPELDPAVAEAVRRTYVRPLGDAAAQRHRAAIAAALTADAEPAAHDAPRRRRVWLPVVAAGAAAFALPAGLAAAGMPLPNVVNKPYRAIGITLPHQAPDASSAPQPSTTRAPDAMSTTPQAPGPADQGERGVRAGQRRGPSGTRKPRRAAGTSAAPARGGRVTPNRSGTGPATRAPAPSKPQPETETRSETTSSPPAAAGPDDTRGGATPAIPPVVEPPVAQPPAIEPPAVEPPLAEAPSGNATAPGQLKPKPPKKK